MQAPTPIWFTYFLCGLCIALLLCLFLLPATALPGGISMARRVSTLFSLR